MTHYKSVEFLSVFRVSSPPAQTQISPAVRQSLPIENFLATVLTGNKDRLCLEHPRLSERNLRRSWN